MVSCDFGDVYVCVPLATKVMEIAMHRAAVHQLTWSKQAGSGWCKWCSLLAPKLQCAADWQTTHPLLHLSSRTTHSKSTKLQADAGSLPLCLRKIVNLPILCMPRTNVAPKIVPRERRVCREWREKQEDIQGE